ncbi:MAG: LamG domain-containing protein [Dehalococcoidia bacterium]|nr:LamG domain-containing protein [Dehalococcoidia bacterium]
MTTKLWTPKGGLITPKPPSYLKLDMAFGIGAGTTLFDKSRYRSHGTISGASWADGVHGKALDFNPATPDYVEIPATSTQLNFTSEDFSIVIRFKIDNLDEHRLLLIKGAWETGGWAVFIRSTGQVRAYTFQTGAGTYWYSDVGDIVIATNYTLGLTRDGAVGKVYINGVDAGGGSQALADPVSTAAKAYIGVRENLTSSPFDGKMEFLRIFGGIALPASTHLAWHNALA